MGGSGKSTATVSGDVIHSSTTSSRLNASEVDALEMYMTYHYKRINDYLRGTLQSPFDEADLASAMDSAFSKAPPHQPFTVYRGVAGGFGSSLQVGDRFTDKGFTSTSTKRSIAETVASPAGGRGEGNPVIFEVRVPSSVKALSVRDLRKGRDYEVGEVVLNRNTSFTVTGVTKGTTQTPTVVTVIAS